MTRTDLRHFIAGMLATVAFNLLGWALAFVAGSPTIRPGWGLGLLSNIPLGVAIIVAMLIYVFDKHWAD